MVLSLSKDYGGPGESEGSKEEIGMKKELKDEG
jgi:hypothetical protein